MIIKLKLNGKTYNINTDAYPDNYGEKIVEQAKKFGYMCYNYYEKIDDDRSYLIAFSKAYGIKKSIVDNNDIEKLSKCTWRPSKNPKDKNFYMINNTYGKMHRYIMGMTKNVNKEFKVDHIDRNTLNNSKSNLRIVTQAENCKNSSIRSDNTSGIKGIRMDKNKTRWESEIWVNNKKYNKTFSINKYGYDEALRLAKEYRLKIANENGFLNPFE